MDITLLVTRSCHHCALIEKELNARHFEYEVQYAEDNPALASRFGVKQSPNIIVNGELIYRGMPDLPELQNYLDSLQAQPEKAAHS